MAKKPESAREPDITVEVKVRVKLTLDEIVTALQTAAVEKLERDGSKTPSIYFGQAQVEFDLSDATNELGNPITVNGATVTAIDKAPVR